MDAIDTAPEATGAPSRGVAPRSPTATTPRLEPAERSAEAELIRRELADAWASMGAAWGVAPAVARVHAYLMARAEPLTEREVREALDLSHRAASQALSEAVAWGVVEPVLQPRRVGRRGPAGTAYRAVDDPWRWFARVVAERKLREGDPIVVALERAAREASTSLEAHPDDAELLRLRDWLTTFMAFVRLFDRALGLVPQVEPHGMERILLLLAQVPDETIVRLVALLDALPDEDVIALVTSVSRLSPAAARRATRLMSGVVRTVGR